MKHSISALAATALVALSLGAPVLAQGPGGGGPGGGGPGGGGGFGGQRRMPFAIGTVSAVDATAGTITVTSPMNGNGPQTIKVGADVQITTQTTATVADLKVGDQITVQGVPTGITASQITAGQPPTGMPGAGGRGFGGGGFGGGGFGGPRGGAGNGGNAAGGAASQATAAASGTIKTLPATATDPLVISLGTDVTLSLTIPSTTKITKYTTLTLAGIKTGDQVMATGQAGDDGTFTASAVGVNLPGGFGGPGGFGRGGGRGRRGGGGGPGGFGGPGNGGGFGGPGGGGPGGGGGAPPPPDGGAPPPPADGGAPPPPVQ